MHQYSIDRKIRERIVYITVILSAALSIALKEVCADIISGLDSIIAGSKVEDGKALCIKRGETEAVEYPVDALVTIAEFGEPIYPYLKPTSLIPTGFRKSTILMETSWITEWIICGGYPFLKIVGRSDISRELKIERKRYEQLTVNKQSSLAQEMKRLHTSDFINLG